ncbi:diguanylate cyclase [Thalassotalea sp. PLHSN55]|uniref:GGDEF domain-containing protein n=1 Tax=Thalassotalea sp. PLHSN55 TaxID=3435888 RepID=UPI003F8710B6
MIKLGLKQRILCFSIFAGIIFVWVISHVLFSWDTINTALERDNYARQISTHTDHIAQAVIIDQFSYSQGKKNTWLDHHSQLSRLLATPPPLTPAQKTLQNSIDSQNNSIKILYNHLQGELLTKDISEHLLSKLVTQIESIKADSKQLSLIAQLDIVSTIKKAIFLSIILLTVAASILLFGLFRIANIFTVSLMELQQAIEKNHSGNFQDVKLSYDFPETRMIVNKFNSMNKELSENTITLDALQKAVDERTHDLTELSNTDALTNVANRRALFQRGNIEFSRATRQNTDLTAVLLDCDFFKEVNDKYGHLIGDQLLIHLCKICAAEIRDIDFIARYGGEEFFLLLPNCNTNDAFDIGKRIQKSLANSPLRVENEDVFITVSIGITSHTKKHKNFEQLINDADKAMYIAKNKGRNRIETTQPNALH